MEAGVFFLEDDPDLIFAYQKIAESCGCEVVAATNVHAMMDHASQILRCKVAFLDIQLGRGEPNGIDALNWLRTHNFDGRIHILTGHGKDNFLVIKAREKGNVDILTKPISSKLLKTFIREGLGEYKS